MKEIYNMLISENDTISKTGIILLFSLSEKEFKEFLNYSPDGGIHYKRRYYVTVNTYRNRLMLDVRLNKIDNALLVEDVLKQYDLFDEIISML